MMTRSEGAVELGEVVGVAGVHLDAVLAPDAFEHKPALSHGVQVLTPRVEEGDVLAAAGHVASPGGRRWRLRR